MTSTYKVNFDRTLHSMNPQPRFGENLRTFNLADRTGVVFEIGNRICKLSNEDVRALRDVLNGYLEEV
jgi:hypothetical protein